MDTQNWANIAGIIFGSGAILSVTIVYIRSQKLGFTGLGFAFVGMILVGMSIWSSIKISVNENGIETELERLHRQVGEIAQASVTVSDTVASVVEEAERNRSNVSELAAAIESTPTESLANLESILTEKSVVERVDLQSLNTARAMFHEVNAGDLN